MNKPENLDTNTGKGPFSKKNKAFVIAIALFVFLRVVTLIATPNSHSGFASDLTLESILNAVNRERSLRNITTLNTNDKLSLAGQSKSDDMQARHYFAHVDPDGNYVWDKIVAAGYTPYLQLGENLAIEFYDTESLMSAWMNSPTHRANILQEGFRDQGMGINIGDSGLGQYHSAITNTFGTLASPAKEVKPAPSPAPPKKVEPPPSVPAPAPVPKETPKAPEPTPKPTTPVSTPKEPEAITTPTPAPAPKNDPLNIRGNAPLAINPESDFSLPNHEEPNKEPITTSTPESAEIKSSAANFAVVGNPDANILTDYQTNRYLILICGVALLLLMLSDIRIIIERKFGSLDKKINNLAVLLISLVVIAFMYWV